MSTATEAAPVVNTAEHLISVAQAYVAALNTSNLQAVVSLFADDATVEDPVGTEARRGIDAIRGFFERVTSMPMDVVLDGEVRAAANEVAFGLKLSFVREGRPTTVAAIDHFRLNEAGKIVAMRAFFGPKNIHVG